MFVLGFYRKYVPLTIKRYLHVSFYIGSLKEWLYIRSIEKKQRDALSSLKCKTTIKCVFFALFEDVWKYDRVYQLMERHPRFEPVILVCPIQNYGYENMLHRMKRAYNFFLRKGYHVICSYDETTGNYLDAKRELKPDIILYTNPYRGLIDDRYYINNFLDTLNVYVPYFMNDTAEYKFAYDQLLHNLVWRMYLESPLSLQSARLSSRRHGQNMVVTGYPGIEPFLDRDNVADDSCWKSKNHALKRIIWAPHHTIFPLGNIYYSCFLYYYDFMLELAEKYKDCVEITFKPHPILRNKLYETWGKDKTDAYYAKWASMENTSLNEGDYVDLFKTSDAMIHDSGSFIMEYMYVNKPVLFCLREDKHQNKYSNLANACFKNYYFSETKDDIEQFVRNILDDVDPLKEQRTLFVKEVLMPNGIPSENILNDILDSIDNQILYRN